MEIYTMERKIYKAQNKGKPEAIESKIEENKTEEDGQKVEEGKLTKIF